MKIRVFLMFIALLAGATVLTIYMGEPAAEAPPRRSKEKRMIDPWTIPMGRKVDLSRKEWKEFLSPEVFYITREKGTERAFSGKYAEFFEPGVYKCACCGIPLFSSKAKFDSGSGWPSFWKPVEEGRVAAESDRSLMMVRTEVHCARCSAHLGHVFEDGPPPTGLRYCLNSPALVFVPSNVQDAGGPG